MNGFTREHYAQLLAYRKEGLANAGALFTDEIEKPKARSFFPTLWPASRQSSYPSIAIGPWRVGAAGPSLIIADEVLEDRSSIKVLDVGCAAGTFREYLRLRRPERKVEYVGIDIASFAVDFPVYRTLDDVRESGFDLVFMSEIAEHMSADVFAQEYLAKVPRLLAAGGMTIIGVPNPLAPGVLHRDVTHVQHYPWFDLYAIARFFFGRVDVLRTHFIHTPRRFFSFPLRRALSYFLEFDWCEGLTLLASDPKAP